MRLEISKRLDTRACVVRLEGDVDLSVVPEIREALASAVDGGCLNVVLDLAKVDYIDSTALGLLVWVDHKLAPLGGRLILSGANKDVSRILELTGLIGLAPTIGTRDTVEDALRGLEEAPGVAAVQWLQSVDIPADVEVLGDTRQKVVDALKEVVPSEATLFDIKVATGEALANAVRHGSPGGPESRISVDVGLAEDRVVIKVTDTGCGYDGSSQDVEDVYAISGRGVMFMRALMDSVEFSRCEGGGTEVMLVKRFHPAEKRTSAE